MSNYLPDGATDEQYTTNPIEKEEREEPNEEERDNPVKRIFVAVKRSAGFGGAITPILEWYLLECGHLVSRHISVAPDPKKLYCSKCSHAAMKEFKAEAK